ncbi:PIG-L deacetylase family protein [Saccharolobus islandicus]|uniref:PIG-L deacetylase family protein n=1 Tax=Saccharolobus islandicus TaxID=43080 RepID=UPI000376C89C|nr:PIG-L family deacetylase [Sulfolobus islandicus]
MILIIAPHPDDDILCCGNIIFQNPNNTKVIFVTDGSKGSPRTEEWGREFALKRMNEAYNALKKLGLTKKENILFLNYEDGMVAKNKSKIYKELFNIITQNNAKTIYFPSPFDFHLDHSNLGKIVLSIINNHKLNRLDLFMYTIHRQIALQRDILETIYKLILKVGISLSWKYVCFKVNDVSIKKQALEEHKSQLLYMREEVRKLAEINEECFYFKHIK